MIQCLVRWVISHPIVVAILSVTAVTVVAVGLTTLTFRSDHRIFFSAENEDLVAFEALEKTYTKSDNLVFVVTAKEDDVFRPKILDALLELTRAAWTLPYIKRVDSIVNFQHVSATGDDIVIDHLLREQDPKTAETIERVRSAALSEPLLVNRIISPDGTVTGVFARFDIDLAEKDSAIPEIMTMARAIARAMEETHPGTDIRISGSVPMDFAFVEASEQDLSFLTPLMLTVIVVLIGVILGSVWGAMMTFMIIVLSIVGAMGAAGLLHVPLSPPSATAPNIIMTLATADCVHLIWSTMRHIHSGLPKKEAVANALSENLRAIFFTSATTAIGFLSLNFSESPPFRHLGTITGIGVAIAFVLSVTLLPAALVLLPVKPRQTSEWLQAVCERIHGFVSKRAGSVMWGTLAVGVSIAGFAFTNKLDDRFIEYFDDSFAFRRDTDYMNDRLTGIYYIDYSLAQPNANGIANPAYLAEIEAFANWLRQQPKVTHVEVFTDVLKKINRVMHADEVDEYRIPENRATAAQYLLLYEMSLPYGLDLKDRMTLDKSATRMTVTLGNVSTEAVLSLLDGARDWAGQHLALVAAPQGTGTTVLFSRIGMRNIREMLTGTFAALVGISALLFFIFRSIPAGLIGIVTNLLPALVALGAWALIMGEVGMAVSVIAAMTLGIVVDDTIHFMEKYLYARRALQEIPVVAVRYAFVVSGPAMLTTTIVLSSGFFCLAFSGFQINAWIGLMTAITIIVALVFDFLLLPAFLIKIGTRLC